MSSLLVWPKVITLWGFYCILKTKRTPMSSVSDLDIGPAKLGNGDLV